VTPSAKFSIVTAILDCFDKDFLLAMGSSPGRDVLDFITEMKFPRLTGSE
jgi:hypothetical protein